LLNLVLAVKGRHVILVIGEDGACGLSTKDNLFDTGRDGRVGDRLSLTDLALLEIGDVIGEGGEVDSMGSLQDPWEGRSIVCVTLDNLGTLLLEGFGRGLVGVAADGADVVLLGQLWIVQESVDDGSTLITSGTKDDKDLL